jgi:hypothetical protein
MTAYARLVTPIARPQSEEICLRCGAAMEWLHGTWQCPRCRLKIGCCEGATGECTAESTSRP